MKRPIITLLTDFGTSDHYVAAMKGVILGICPNAELVDISHHITPYSIPEAAYTLAQAWHCFPKGAIHLAVVDPGVGSKRRAIIAEAAGHRFVAPDNGLLSFVLRAVPKATVREISETRFFREPVSPTFHGRDIFAPVSAHLARGIVPKRIGKVLQDTVIGDFTEIRQDRAGNWLATVLKIDSFGNIISSLESDTFRWVSHSPFRLRVGRHTIKTFRQTYAEARTDEVFALFGSSGFIEVSLNQSNAAKRLGVSPGARVTLGTPVVDRVLERASGSN
jgi:hypothetical protein